VRLCPFVTDLSHAPIPYYQVLSVRCPDLAADATRRISVHPHSHPYEATGHLQQLRREVRKRLGNVALQAQRTSKGLQKWAEAVASPGVLHEHLEIDAKGYPVTYRPAAQHDAHAWVRRRIGEATTSAVIANFAVRLA